MSVLFMQAVRADVASDLRGQNIGQLLMKDAKKRVHAAGCTLLQLTTNASRDRARSF